MWCIPLWFAALTERQLWQTHYKKKILTYNFILKTNHISCTNVCIYCLPNICLLNLSKTVWSFFINLLKLQHLAIIHLGWEPDWHLIGISFNYKLWLIDGFYTEQRNHFDQFCLLNLLTHLKSVMQSGKNWTC